MMISALVIVAFVAMSMIGFMVAIRVLKIPNLPAWRIVLGIVVFGLSMQVLWGTMDAIEQVYDQGELILLAVAFGGVLLVVGSAGRGAYRWWKAG